MPVPHESQAIKKLLSAKFGAEIHDLTVGESTEYEACHFQLGDKSVEFRTSKITPKKNGQFVAIWKRNEQGLTQPFEDTDQLDLMIISSKREDNWGLFIFPKAVLIQQAIITSKGRNGKRGIRVYPPWEEPTSRQAAKTQEWQVRYFVEVGGLLQRGQF